MIGQVHQIQAILEPSGVAERGDSTWIQIPVLQFTSLLLNTSGSHLPPRGHCPVRASALDC